MTKEGSKSSTSGKSVILAHPHTLIREGLGRILQEGGFSVLETTDDLADLHKFVSQAKPEIILLDWEISETQIDAVKTLSKTFPEATVVVLTRPHASQDFLEALAAGAGGYLSVNLSSEDFVQSLRMLASGSLVVAKEKMVGEEIELDLQKPPTPYEELSEREKDVLVLLGKGSTNREIAEDLIISEHTVKVHLRTILNKLALRNRQQAAAYAVQMGLVKDVIADKDQELTA
jgi:DNA-binding NarL/FixJ family response regulator